MWKYIKEKYDIPNVGQKWALKTIQDAWRTFSYNQEKNKEVDGVVSSKDFFVATRCRKPNRIYKKSYGDIICKIAEIEKIQTQEIEDGTELVMSLR